MSQPTKLIASLTNGQRIVIVLTAIGIAAGLWAAVRWNKESNFKPLYTSMSPEDGGAVVERLRERGIEYRLEDNGATIKVPSEKVAEARLQLAASGLPKTGRIGFELFDATNFGLTEFAEQVNYRRAIEGELERTIVTMAEIERARVHISLPKDSVFLESRQEAKASVVVKLRSRLKLSPQNGAAICHLVASAVERLSPDAVAVLDTDGVLLVRPRRASAENPADAPDLTLEYRQSVEKDLIHKINLTLEPLLGAENFRASASVEVDSSRSELSEELFDPNRIVTLTSQKSEDQAGLNQNAGVPGTAANLPRPVTRPVGSGGGVSRKTESTTYQPSKVVRHVQTPQGAIKRVSISVLVGQAVRWQGTGAGAKRTLNVPTPERLKTIQELVVAATGLSTPRDQIIVQTLPFESALSAEPPPDPGAAPGAGTPAWWQKYLSNMSPPLLIGIGVGALCVFLAPVAFLIWRGRKRRKVAVSADAAIEAGADDKPPSSLRASKNFEETMAERNLQIERQEQEMLKGLIPPADTKKSEVLNKHLRKLARSDPSGTAHLIRSWLQEK